MEDKTADYETEAEALDAIKETVREWLNSGVLMSVELFKCDGIYTPLFTVTCSGDESKLSLQDLCGDDVLENSYRVIDAYTVDGGSGKVRKVQFYKLGGYDTCLETYQTAIKSLKPNHLLKLEKNLIDPQIEMSSADGAESPRASPAPRAPAPSPKSPRAPAPSPKSPRAKSPAPKLSDECEKGKPFNQHIYVRIYIYI